MNNPTAKDTNGGDDLQRLADATGPYGAKHLK
jgi:hypothetical protein